MELSLLFILSSIFLMYISLLDSDLKGLSSFCFLSDFAFPLFCPHWVNSNDCPHTSFLVLFISTSLFWKILMFISKIYFRFRKVYLVFFKHSALCRISHLVKLFMSSLIVCSSLSFLIIIALNFHLAICRYLYFFSLFL